MDTSFRPLLYFLEPFIALLFTISLLPAAAQDIPEEAPLALLAASPNGVLSPVDGISCDNLRDTLPGEKNHLTILLPGRFREAEAAALVTNLDNTSTDSGGRNNVGSIVSETGRLLYYPPNEFNSNQEPRRRQEVDGAATRRVILTVRARTPDGVWHRFAPLPIVLGRPPILLIHGVNRGPDCWLPFLRDIGCMRGRNRALLEFPFVTLDYFAPGNYAGVNFHDRQKYPEGMFAGGGPVEAGAFLLARRIQSILEAVRNGEALPCFETAARGASGEFAYRDPQSDSPKPLRLAIRRVDVLAWSYGGVIARWYLASKGDKPEPGANWYKGDYGLRAPDGSPLDLTPAVRYQGDIRKLITLGSMWRGVPLINYLNELRFSSPDDPASLANSPIRLPQWMPRTLWNKTGTTRRTMGNLVPAIDARMRVRTPAMEVMAINSPWMSYLNYGAMNPAKNSPARPFRDDVAYGAIAGDNSAYLEFDPLTQIAPYGALSFFQQPSRFSYLALARRAGLRGWLSPVIGGVGDYNDGLVPLWSAMIPGGLPGASLIVPVNHDNFFTNSETQNYIVRWFSHAGLPSGRLLNEQADTPVFSRNRRKRWDFRPGEMAPVPENALYSCIGGVGRIAPAALQPGILLSVARPSKTILRITWRQPDASVLRRVTLYESDPRYPLGTRLIKARSFPVDGRDTQSNPSALVENAPEDKTYFITVDTEMENDPDPPVVFRSPPVRLAETPAPK
jgi:hypothetical protein